MTYALAMAPINIAKRATPFAVSDTVLVDMARRLYELRKVRDAMLGDALFSEPAWDILLDLFISEHEQRRLSVSAVCIGARAPSATALRYLTMLQDADLVERIRDARDGRRSHVQLTVLGRLRMTNLLGRLVDA
ncbi:transcriptional regulator [Sphingomonas sp. PAMC26645]|uniref:winged helix DNA-binding protein n=1 Tax=Sphingomonas sp. PAMC26645 TaxID=2565555 RepID=UPI00109D991A|nr:winged helix DNA-binding protein [Sphingomonas sp. PAMC26645]QCB44120.1 transcriptional regulator [Sphingomonas sp. PAMC26645]